jgi:hypothetical protein
MTSILKRKEYIENQNDKYYECCSQRRFERQRGSGCFSMFICMQRDVCGLTSLACGPVFLKHPMVQRVKWFYVLALILSLLIFEVTS